MVQEEAAGCRMAAREGSRHLAVALILVASTAALVMVCIAVGGSDPRTELFGGDAFNPGGDSASNSVYGPVNFYMDPAMKRELKEYANHGGNFKHGDAWQSHGSSLESQLGPQAAGMLRSRSTTDALRAYRQAPRDEQLHAAAQPRTQQLSEEVEQQQQPSVRSMPTGAAEPFASTWHPNRMQDSRGTGASLLNSRETQDALRELREHTDSSGAQQQRPIVSLQQEQQDVSKPGAEALLATKLQGDAGFTQVHNRAQALEAIKDLLSERLGDLGQESVAHTQELSTAHGLKVQRARLEGLMQSINKVEDDMHETKHMLGRQHAERGRTAGDGIKSREEKLLKLKQMYAVKINDLHVVAHENSEESEEARDAEGQALAMERKEMAAYGKAEMARRNALQIGHSLLTEKKHAKLLANEVEHDARRADEFEREARELKHRSIAERERFENMAGPVHKAQETVKLANHAYEAAELKLARAETTAETLANHPKLREAAMAQIQKDRSLSSRMGELVQSAMQRLNDLEANDGPLTGIDSHFESPNKRAVRKMARARRIRESSERLSEREAELAEDVKSQLPQLKAAITSAKKLHAKYEAERSLAIRAQKRADIASKRAQEVVHEYDEDRSAAAQLGEMIHLENSGVGKEVKQRYAKDWDELRQMHEELKTDKENYESARIRSCKDGGACPPARPDGLPFTR